MSLRVQNSLPLLNCKSLWSQSGFSTMDVSPKNNNNGTSSTSTSSSTAKRSSIASFGFLGGGSPSKESTKRMELFEDDFHNSRGSSMSLEDPMKEVDEGDLEFRRVVLDKNFAKEQEVVPEEEEEDTGDGVNVTASLHFSSDALNAEPEDTQPEKAEDAQPDEAQLEKAEEVTGESIVFEEKKEENEPTSLHLSSDTADAGPEEKQPEKPKDAEHREESQPEKTENAEHEEAQPEKAAEEVIGESIVSEEKIEEGETASLDSSSDAVDAGETQPENAGKVIGDSMIVTEEKIEEGETASLHYSSDSVNAEHDAQPEEDDGSQHEEAQPGKAKDVTGGSIVTEETAEENESTSVSSGSAVDAGPEETKPEKAEDVTGGSIVTDEKTEENESSSSHYSGDAVDAGESEPEKRVDAEHGEKPSEKAENVIDGSSSNEKQAIFNTPSPTKTKTSQLHPEQLIIKKSFSDGIIDNTNLEYVPIRLECGVNVMCAPQVLSKSPLVLRCLQTDAQRLFTILPRSVHDLLRRTKIWVNASYSYGSFDDPQILRHSTAHHSEEWLVQIAKDIPEKACGIEIYECKYYEKMRLHWNGAGLLLHEFCHLVHQFCLGLDNAKVVELYNKADCSGKYNQTPRRDWAGCVKTHDMAYALVDQKEFFAEMSVTYHSTGYQHLNKGDCSILETCSPPLLLPDVFDRVLRQHGIEDPLERPEDSFCYIFDYAKRRHPKPKLEIADPIFRERAIATNCRNIPICNKFYPFTRGQLKHHDPSLCNSMGELWREIARWKDPEAESNDKCSFLLKG